MQRFLCGCIRVFIFCVLLIALAHNPCFAQSNDLTSASVNHVDASANSKKNPNADILNELERMRARIAELEAQLRAQSGIPAAANAAESGQPQPVTSANANGPASQAGASIERTVATPPADA